MADIRGFVRAEGYSTKFGMQYVNFTTQERFYKASFFHYVQGIQDYLQT